MWQSVFAAMAGVLVAASTLVPVKGISAPDQTKPAVARPTIRASGVNINVDNMEQAVRFYTEKLGFEVADRSHFPKQVELKSGDRMKLFLQLVPKLQKLAGTDAHASFTLQVNDLDQSIARLKSLGVEFAENRPRTEGVGKAISIRDPFGRHISLMHQTIVKVEPFAEPKLYNYGVSIPEMNQAQAFYTEVLGFAVRSQKYLPLDLPLGHADKTFAFMLHYRPGITPISKAAPNRAPLVTIRFETDDLKGALEWLKKSGVRLRHSKPQNGPNGLFVEFEDPFGIVSELIQPTK